MFAVSSAKFIETFMIFFAISLFYPISFPQPFGEQSLPFLSANITFPFPQTSTLTSFLISFPHPDFSLFFQQSHRIIW